MTHAQILMAFLDRARAIMPSLPALYDGDAYKVLIFCIISLRTKDEVAFPAANRLFAQASTPKAMAKLSADAIAQWIYPAGFYQRKALQILDIAQDLASKNLAQPPSTTAELLAYKGVGLKTANLTLSRGFGLPAICVDIHVHRIVNRMGVVQTDTPDATEAALRELLPPDHWINVNPILVYLGQQYCGVKPKCNTCPLAETCPYNTHR
jgi:endonuclease III